MKKKLFTLLLSVCLAVLLAAPAFAENGYTITNYDVQATLHKDNTVSQTETIEVNFTQPKHGIFRAWPEVVTVQKEVDGALKDMRYPVKISNVWVEGAASETSTEDGIFYLRIGDEDTVLTGAVTYVIHFTYDIGDDRVPDYDELFYSINGPDWDVTIENFSFHMDFEKPLPADSVDNFALYSGIYGALDNEAGIEAEMTESYIEGYSTQPLAPHTGVTLYTRMAEGYFEGVHKPSVIPAYTVLALLAVLVVYILVRVLTNPRRRTVQTVEFYPPEGITSAEVGYIIDGSADDKDMLSLVVWLADKGYVSLRDEGEDALVITRLKQLPADAPAYLKKFFDALFALGESRNLGAVSKSFYDDFCSAKSQLAEHFVDERALQEKKGSLAAFGMPLLAVILWVVLAITADAFMFSDTLITAALAAIPLIGILLWCINADKKWRFAKHIARVWYVIVPILLAALGAGLSAVSVGVLLPTWFTVVPYLAVALCCVLAPRLARETAYRTEMAGKLLGLRSFIEKAELPRLKVLLEDDPSYFYNILPYAYVFGLSNRWIKQFETLAVAPPQWYSGSDVFTYMMLTRAIDRGLSHSMQEIHAQYAAQSKSGGSGGTGFGGGGGFSGGGFGGGGGGSW